MKKLALENTPLNLELTLTCGQAFRWRQEKAGFWSAPVSGNLWRVKEKNGILFYEGLSEEELIHYFALDLDLDDILADIDRDPLMHQAVETCRGLRILRQPKWECLVSYICSSCANIPCIQNRIENLSEKFGSPNAKGRFAFPEPETLAKAGLSEIRSCKTGYRDAYISDAARFCAGTDFLNRTACLPYEKAKDALMQIQGVGPKVADCVLLFSFEKYEAFPVDVWIERILRTKYLCCEQKLSYAKAGGFARKHFGKYAGYAQEYLFGMREMLVKKGE
ncbi:MAG TPA: DNA glycosylase [Methanocorpusculum sp.]|nr:DNA glycosylase [Methanocorpusculum sp.]